MSKLPARKIDRNRDKDDRVGGGGGICPVSSKIELVAKIFAKSLVLEKEETAVEPSD